MQCGKENEKIALIKKSIAVTGASCTNVYDFGKETRKANGISSNTGANRYDPAAIKYTYTYPREHSYVNIH